jgi:RNA polymerase sigma factor (sigma-70 family)
VNRIVEQLRRAVLAHNGGGLTDGQLLQCFVVHHDEAAFEAIVRRHGPMVWGVCRRIAGNTHDADDAFQATFLVLVRRAASLGAPELVGNWLHGVACRTALKARANRFRRRQREGALEDAPEPAIEHKPHEDWKPHLDQALNQLPDLYRVPVVLCELEGRSRAEVARQLQLPEGTLSSRLAKARNLLARRLARQGLVLSSLSLTAALARGAPVPPELIASTTQTALAGAVERGIIPVLLEGVQQAMTLTRIKVAAVLLTVATMLGVSSSLKQPALAGKPATIAAAATAQKEKKERGPSVHGVVKSVEPGKNTIVVTVRKDAAKKETEEQTHTLAADVKVTLQDNLTKKEAPPMGTVADLSEGTEVTLELAVDRKSVVAISARGPGLHGSIKSVAADKKSITVTSKDKTGAIEKTLTLAKGIRIIKDDGLGRKKSDPPKEGTIEDLNEGTNVSIQLSVNRKTALGINILGMALHGTIKSYDSGTQTLTVTVKEDAQIVDKDLKLAKNARVEGDLTQGARVAVTLSVHDKEVAAAVRVLKD